MGVTNKLYRQRDGKRLLPEGRHHVEPDAAIPCKSAGAPAPAASANALMIPPTCHYGEALAALERCAADAHRSSDSASDAIRPLCQSLLSSLGAATEDREVAGGTASRS